MGSASHTVQQAGQAQEVTVPTTLQTGTGLVFRPRVEVVQVTHSRPTIFRIHGDQKDSSVFPWGFWIGAISLAIGAAILVYFGSLGFWSIFESMIGIGAVVLGIMFLKYGVTSRFKPTEIATIDELAGTLRLSTDVVVPLAEIEEVVFGLTRYPEAGVKVMAFTLLVRHHQSLIPVVEASPNKGPLFEVAKVVAKMCGAPLTQVGEGVN